MAHCKDCGQEYPYEFSYDDKPNSRPERCPNCRKLLSREIGLAYSTISIGDAILFQGSREKLGAGKLGKLSDPDQRRTLREWWHSMLRSHGRYSCYAMLLVLPSDKEMIRYLSKFGLELDLISGQNCLIIVLGNTEFQRLGLDDNFWDVAIREHIFDGHSTLVARFFKIGFDKFPCMIFFNDIRSPEYVLLSLKGLLVDEVAEEMRRTFTIIQEAISNKKNPIKALEDRQALLEIGETSKRFFSKLSGFAEKTFETGMEAWINSIIKVK